MNNISNCNISMEFSAEVAAEELAKGLLLQAESNLTWAKAALKLAEVLVPTDACAIRIVNNESALSGFEGDEDE